MTNLLDLHFCCCQPFSQRYLSVLVLANELLLFAVLKALQLS